MKFKAAKGENKKEIGAFDVRQARLLMFHASFWWVRVCLIVEIIAKHIRLCISFFFFLCASMFFLNEYGLDTANVCFNTLRVFVRFVFKVLGVYSSVLEFCGDFFFPSFDNYLLWNWLLKRFLTFWTDGCSALKNVEFEEVDLSEISCRFQVLYWKKKKEEERKKERPALCLESSIKRTC